MDRRYDVVVIVASLGGIEALGDVVRALPARFPLPVAVVQHRTMAYPYLLEKVLGRQSLLRVRQVVEGEAAAPGTIYLAPPGLHLMFDDRGRLHTVDGRRINFTMSSGDPLFSSAARAFGGRVIGVVLSGTGKDGAVGARAIKDAGGTVIVQDAASSRSFAMPRAAIATGAVDAILPVDEIAPTLARLAAVAS